MYNTLQIIYSYRIYLFVSSLTHSTRQRRKLRWSQAPNTSEYLNFVSYDAMRHRSFELNSIASNILERKSFEMRIHAQELSRFSFPFARSCWCPWHNARLVYTESTTNDENRKQTICV